jgi:hypothetical protein
LLFTLYESFAQKIRHAAVAAAGKTVHYAAAAHKKQKTPDSRLAPFAAG